MNGMKGIGIVGRIAKGSLVALAAVLALGLTALPAQAATFTVPSGAFPTITAALGAGPLPGDTVKVKKGGGSGLDGEYHEEGLKIVTPGIKFICAKGAVIDGSVPTGVTTVSSGSGPGPTHLSGPGSWSMRTGSWCRAARSRTSTATA